MFISKTKHLHKNGKDTFKMTAEMTETDVFSYRPKFRL